MNDIYALIDDLRQDLESLEAADHERLFEIFMDYAKKDVKEIERKLKELTFFNR